MYTSLGKGWLIRSKEEICLKSFFKTAFFVFLPKWSNNDKRRVGFENILKKLPSLQRDCRDGVRVRMYVIKISIQEIYSLTRVIPCQSKFHRSHLSNYWPNKPVVLFEKGYSYTTYFNWIQRIIYEEEGSP